MTMAEKIRILRLRSVILLLLLARESVSILFNRTSYIETKPVDITKQFTLSFRTCEGGTLLHQNGDNSDYFKIDVLPGTMNYTTGVFSPSSLALKLQTTGSQAEIHVGSQLDQNKPYYVIFTPRATSHNASQNATLSISLGTIMLDTVQVPDALYNIRADNLTLGKGFVGCITFGDMFDLNVSKTVGISEQCPLDSGRRCPRKACPSGYKGYYCEIDINECGSSPCHHASTCIHGIANYTCSCGPAWFGRNCDNLRNKTVCDYAPCENGGICQHVSDFNNYTCTCLPPYTGRNCTEKADPCKSSPCQNNATCRNIRGVDFQCNCQTGFAGRHCETNIDDCASADCGQGRCIDGVVQHTCNCSSGYTGDDCKDDINECAGTPCMNNATCSNYAGGYLCTCVGDYQGENCEKRIDDCLAKPCNNGGNCTDLIKDFKCVCPAGFSGKRCKTVLHDCNVIGCTACDVMPCNHGNCSCSCTANAMYYNCSCNIGYRGVTCDEDINECMNGSSPSKICGDNGTCKNINGSFKCECSEGFAGRYCNETEGPCNPNPCIHGVCASVNVTANMNTSLVSGNSTTFTESYNCSCFAGWRGRNCSEDIDECEEKIDTCNRTKSQCINTPGEYKCRCFAGYEGIECKDIDECETIAPCKRGLCKNKDGDYECFCRNGFQGRNCSINVPDCLPNPCQHGRCEDGVAKFTCYCEVGWTGTKCEHDINECSLGYCKNNASCNNTEGSYACTCLAGYTDMNCTTDIDDCVGPACQNGGTCTDKVNDYECTCRGYEGKSCETKIDWCDVTRNNGSVPCDYGICKNGLLNYTCQCFDGFSGRNCSIDEDECTSMPCENGAFCVQRSNATAVKLYFDLNQNYRKNESAGYLCVCQPGYNGSNCDNNINECLLYRACNVNGTEDCIDGINNYTCICKSGYTGRNCSEDIDECSSSPCLNNATCQNLIAQYTCICDSNHTGVNCESLVDPCTSLMPCQNGATCNVVSDYNYTCSCAEGFAGLRCTDRTTLGFDGTSSMAVKIPQKFVNISFSFQTIFSEGVLVSESRRWRLSLVSGKLGLMCTDSTCEIGKPGTFTDSNWHRVEVSLNGSYVTAKAGSWNCSRHCGSSRTRRNVAPESQLVVGADSDRPKFVGSMRDFSVNDVKYYPGVNGVSTEGLVPGFQRQNVCSPDPCVNGMCRDLWTRYTCDCDRYWTSTNCTDIVQSGTFGTINQLHSGYRPTDNTSYASYSVSTTFDDLSFTVRTRSTSSLIIRLSYNNSTFLSIETDSNGFLRLRENDGLLNPQPSSAPKINDAAEYFVYINRSVIQVDNMTYPVTMTSLSVRNVFVGGLLENIDRVSGHAQFRGCIRDVRLNGQQLLFFNQTAVGFNSSQKNIDVGCSGEDVCANVSGSTPCSNGGNCTDLWNDFQCKCPSPYGGDNCELYGCEWTNPCLDNSTCVNLKATSEYECISQVTFNDSYSSAYFTNSTPLSDLGSLVTQFRTRQNDTVILSSVHNATYFEISVEDGRVRVMYNLAENMSGVVSTDVFVSDGNWYELKVESIASRTYFKISSMNINQDKLTLLNSELRNISLLNHSFANLLSKGGVRIASSSINSTRDHLLGCLREVRLGKHLLTFIESITVDSSPVFRLAKSAFSSAGISNVSIGCHGNDLCTDTLCGNGTCVKGWNEFHCMCPVGHSGDRCQFNLCTSSPCGNSTCTVHDTGFKCTCAKNYIGAYCNETCNRDVCKNGGNCSISGGKITCKCESDWTGTRCESAVPRDDDDDDDDDDLPLIIGLAVAGGVLLLLVIAVIFICTRQTSSTFGTYSPSSEEKSGARVEMNPVLNVPPPEKLI